MKRFFLAIFLFLIGSLTGCGGSANSTPTPELVFTYIVTDVAGPTSIARTPVTPTHLGSTGQPTGTVTPLATLIPGPSATTQANANLTHPKGSGYYLVGTEISSGKWESQGSGNDCVWEVYDGDQEVEKSYFGYAGGTVTILPSHYAVEFYDCGQWNYIEDAGRDLLSTAFDDKSDGIYTVGVEIADGTWESEGSGDACYWLVYDDQQNLIQQYSGDAGGLVILLPTAYEFLFEDCGTMVYLGP